MKISPKRLREIIAEEIVKDDLDEALKAVKKALLVENEGEKPDTSTVYGQQLNVSLRTYAKALENFVNTFVPKEGSEGRVGLKTMQSQFGANQTVMDDIKKYIERGADISPRVIDSEIIQKIKELIFKINQPTRDIEDARSRRAQKVHGRPQRSAKSSRLNPDQQDQQSRAEIERANILSFLQESIEIEIIDD